MMDTQTKRNLERAEHDARWTPLVHHPQGRVLRPSKQMVAILKTVAGITQTTWAPGGWQENPGPDARLCPNCESWVPAGLAHVQRDGDKASSATYTTHCPFCEHQL